jgi:hypothetical protein
LPRVSWSAKVFGRCQCCLTMEDRVSFSLIDFVSLDWWSVLALAFLFACFLNFVLISKIINFKISNIYFMPHSLAVALGRIYVSGFIILFVLSCKSLIWSLFLDLFYITAFIGILNGDNNCF